MTTIFVKLIIAAAVFLGLTTAVFLWRGSVYREGKVAGRAEITAQIDARNKEVERLNKQVVAQDQEIISAKEADKEKVTTIYRTIREQLEPQIVEKTIFRDCRVGPDVLRGLVAAAEGGMPADPVKPESGPASQVAGAGR